MSGDDDDIFDSEVGSTEGVSPEAPETQPEAKAQPRDETGKFASKGEPEAVEPKVESAPPAPTKQDDDAMAGRLAAMLDERDKRKRLEAERDELRRQLAARQQEAPPLDPIEDPAGFQQAIVNQMQGQFMARFLGQSRFMAERDHGADFINEMMEFFDTQPRDVSAQFLQAPSPVHAAADWYKRHKAFSEIGDDPSAYRSRIEAEIRAKVLAEMGQPQVEAAPSPSKVPKSLASASGTGRPSPTAGGDPLFD